MASRRHSRSAERDRALRAVDASAAGLARFTRELVRSRSITGDEDEAQEIVRDKLRELGASVDLWRPKRGEFKGYEGFIEEEKRVGQRPDVVGRFRGGSSKKTLAFNGHVDVVPEGDLSTWRYPPFDGRLADGKIFGRGACDMKGGLAAAIYGVKAALESDLPFSNDILVQSVIGEESGGMGTLATIFRGYRPDATIIAEPTSLALTIAQAGCLMFRLTVRGKAAHGASRYMGVSAVEKFQPILRGLQRLEAERKSMKKLPLYAGVPNPVTLSVGTVHAGNWDSTVPDTLVAEGRYGVWPGEALDEARRMFEAAVASAAAADDWLKAAPPTVAWYGPQWESAQLPPSHWLCRLVAGSYSRALGGTPSLAGITGGTDMRLYTGVARSPAVIFGPGDDSIAHFSDEYVEVRELVKACKVYAMAALSWNE